MTLQKDSVVDVEVTRVSDDGLDVELNGYSGVVRIIDLAWDTHGLLETIYRDFKVGDNIKVKVMAIDGNRFLGSIKDLHPDNNPWNEPSIYQIGNKFKAVVEREVDFGYFVRLETGAVALMQKKGCKKYHPGNEVDVLVTNIDSKLQKLLVETV